MIFRVLGWILGEVMYRTRLSNIPVGFVGGIMLSARTLAEPLGRIAINSADYINASKALPVTFSVLKRLQSSSSSCALSLAHTTTSFTVHTDTSDG